MIQLFLDGHLVIPTDNSSIKLTVENPYFTKSTSYTYDVELPLAIDENRELFGFINRIDVEKETKTFDARLIVDNVCVLAGTAHITSISETAVKVQLLGSAASYNYGNKMDGLYLDELEMGEWFTTTWPDRSHWVQRGRDDPGHWEYYPEDVIFEGVNSIVFDRAQYTESGAKQSLVEALFSGSLPWCAFPTINATADFLCNGLHFRLKSTSSNVLETFFRGYVGEMPQHRDTTNPIIVSGAIQPYVWIMAQKVAEATGFNLEKEDNALWTNEFFRKIFIVNTNNLILCNKCLPHWTVNEWWTQLEQTFGVILSVDYDSRRIRLLHRDDHYATVAGKKYLTEIVDEFTADVDDDTQSDISVNNVGFADFECSKAERLSEFILTSADRNTDFDDLAALSAWSGEQGAEAMADMKSVIFECKDGRHFIYTEAEGLVEVDMYRPRIARPDKDSVEVELKFVPAELTEGEAYVYRPLGISGGTPPPDTPIATIPVRMIEAPGISAMDWYKDHVNTLDIEAIINEDEEEGSVTDESSDLIYIAIANFDMGHITVDTDLSTGQHVSQQVEWPWPYLRERGHAAIGASPEYDDSPYSLSLIPIEGQQNLASNTVKRAIRIDTTVRHCIRFISDRVPDPGDVFIIRNRRFVCEKIEVDIASTGLRKQMTGYFYEYN